MRISLISSHAEPVDLQAEKPEVITKDASHLSDLAKKQSVHANECIYCESPERLTDEHVIPFAFGGNLKIFKGSCERCRDVTQRFENFALNDGTMAEVRKARGIQSRSQHRSAKTTTKVTLLKDGNLVEAELNTEDVPVQLGFPWLSLPGRLAGNDQQTISLDGWIATSFGPDVAQFLATHQADELRLEEAKKDVVAFAQTIAKVAYCYAWVDGVFDLVEGGGRVLADAFMNEPDRLGAFVGMKQPPFEKIDGCDFRLEYRIKAPELIVYMEVQPFPNVPAPSYLVVLGRCTDLRTWRRIRKQISAGFN